MNLSQFNILGSSCYLPKQCMSAEQMDAKLKVSKGTSYRKSGVAKRYFREDESIASMAAHAVQGALDDAQIQFSDLDALIFAATCQHQPIPCTAAIVQNELGGGDSGVACFDMNATCLSFLVAMDYALLALAGRRYGRIAVVSAESARDNLNDDHLESAALFGDGSAAFVFERNASDSGIRLVKSHMETYGAHAGLCEVKGGGVALPPMEYSDERHADFCFSMDGPKLFKATRKYFTRFLDALFADTDYSIDDVDVLVPHQGSRAALEIFKRHVGIPHDRWVDILESHGNQVSVSIPMALHRALKDNRIQEGNLVLVLGTGAGLALGAHLLKF